MIGITVILSEIVGENGANGDKFLYHKVCLAPTTLDRPYSLPLKCKNMAEDIKMNVFPQVTNAEYIYGELVDGSQVKINKNELACLIGAVIYSSSISDLDKIETSGIYSIGDKCENVPSVIVKTCSDICFTIGQKNCQMFVAKLHKFHHPHNRMRFYPAHSVLSFPDFAVDTFLPQRFLR